MVWIPLPKLLPVPCTILVLIYNKLSSEPPCPSAQRLGRRVPRYVFKLRLKLDILLSHGPRLCHWILHLGNENTASFLMPFGRPGTQFGHLCRSTGHVFRNKVFKWHKIPKQVNCTNLLNQISYKKKKPTHPHHTHILGMLLIISQHFLVFLICNFHYNYPKSTPHFLSENNNQNQHVYTSWWKPLSEKLSKRYTLKTPLLMLKWHSKIT